jgi:hypothetical protein
LSLLAQHNGLFVGPAEIGPFDLRRLNGWVWQRGGVRYSTIFIPNVWACTLAALGMKIVSALRRAKTLRSSAGLFTFFEWLTAILAWPLQICCNDRITNN